MRDHVDDANPSYLYKAADTIQLPEYVLQGNTLTADDVKDLHDRAFADPQSRMFPIHTKEATVMSAMAYFGQGGANSHITARIRSAAGQHGVLDLERQLESCFATTVKSASAAEPVFALKIEGDASHPTQFLYPIDSETEIIDSARYLTKDAADNRLPLSFVRAAAQTLVKRATELGLPVKQIIPAVVLNLGEDRIPNFDTAKEAAERRLEFCGVNDDAYALLVDSVEAAKEAHGRGESIEDFVEVWRMVDDGSQVKYSALIKDPYQVFYSGENRDDVEKFASTIVFVGDTPLPSEVIGSLTDADIDGVFRADTAAVVKQARDAAIGDTPAATQALTALAEPNQRALLNLLLTVA